MHQPVQTFNIQHVFLTFFPHISNQQSSHRRKLLLLLSCFNFGSVFCTAHTRGPFFQQADRAARQKHLHGLDLFLESARAQLKMLIEDQREEDPGD